MLREVREKRRVQPKNQEGATSEVEGNPRECDVLETK